MKKIIFSITIICLVFGIIPTRLDPTRKTKEAVAMDIGIWVSFTDVGHRGPAEIKVAEQDGYSVVVDMTLEGMNVQERRERGERFQFLSIPSADWTNEVGKPKLPVIRKLLIIPSNKDVKIVIEDEEHTVLSGYNVYPVGKSIVRHSRDGAEYIGASFAFDQEFYSSNSFYPEELADISFSGRLRSLNLVQLELHPIRFNPGSGELMCYSFLRVRLSYAGGAGTRACAYEPEQLARMFQREITNYERMAPPAHITKAGEVSYPDNLRGVYTADYVIIAPEPFYSSDKLRELANWRALYSGLDVAVASTERIYSDFEGNSGNPDEKIRNFIQHIYDAWKAPHIPDGRIGYILLLGDVEFIPVHISEGDFWNETIATDNWYVCCSEQALSCSEDVVPDIMLGRIPAKNMDEMNLIIDKIIQYEKNPLYGDWANNVLLMLGTIALCRQDIEYLRDEYLLPAGYNVSEVSALDGGGASDVVCELNRGQHIALYSGHGYVDSWQIFHKRDIPKLRNARKLPAVFSLACNTGYFSHPNTDSLGEAFLKAPNGAIAFFGASGLSPALSGNATIGLSEAVIGLHKYTLGEIVMHVKLMLPYPSTMELYNLLGDPALDLCAARRLPCKADLAVSSADISFKPENPKQGDEVQISVTINNLGTADASNVVVELRHNAGLKPGPMDGELIKTHVISSIPAGSKHECRFIWRAPLGEAQHCFSVRTYLMDSSSEHYREDNDAQKGLLVSLEAEGWPVEVEETTLSAPVAADIDGDGDMELLVQGSMHGGNKVYIWHHDGQAVSGWPRTISLRGSLPPPPPLGQPPPENIKLYFEGQYFNSSAGPAPAVGDLDGDGNSEIVAVFFTRKVYAWRNDGSMFPGWPVSIDGYATSSPVLADLDADGKLEVVFGTSNGQMHVMRYDGSYFSGWPKSVSQKGHLFPVVADMDADGDMEIIALRSPLPKNSGISISELYAWHHDGSVVTGWPVQMEGADAILPPAAGDLDGDGTAEVVAVSVSSDVCKVYVWDHDGKVAPGWPIKTDDEITSAVALGDLDGDGDIEIIACCYNQLAYAWHHDGRRVFGWPVHTGLQKGRNSAPVLGDVDGDGQVEVIFSSDGGIIHAYRRDGVPARSWSAITPEESGWSLSPPVIADMDGEGRMELVYASSSGRIHKLSLIGYCGNQAEMDWNMFLRDHKHTGSCNAKVILPRPPTNLTARDAPADKENSIILSWRLSPDDSKAVGYVIYKSDGRDGPYTVVGEVERGIANYTDDTAQVGVTYWYNVRTSDGRYLSANFEPVSACSFNNFAPKPPKMVCAQKGDIDGTIDIRWVAGKKTDLVGYKVYKGVSPKSYDEPIDVGMTDHYVLTGLTNGTVYYLSVTAYDAEGNESLHSIEVTATPEDDDTQPPSFSAFYPKEVTEGIAFDIRCCISDPSGVYDDSPGLNEQGVYLIWDNDGELSESSHKAPMRLLSPGIYKTDAKIPGQPIGKQIIYQISAYDNDCDWNRIEDRMRGVSQEQIVNILNAPRETVLQQNYPNPFNPETWIPYQLAKDADVSIEIYNRCGQLVRRLDIGFLRRDRYISREKATCWDGRNQIGERVASGIYFYVLRAGDFTATRKMAVLR